MKWTLQKMCKGTSGGCEIVEMSVDFDDVVQNATPDAEMRITSLIYPMKYSHWRTAKTREKSLSFCQCLHTFTGNKYRPMVLHAKQSTTYCWQYCIIIWEVWKPVSQSVDREVDKIFPRTLISSENLLNSVCLLKRCAEEMEMRFPPKWWFIVDSHFPCFLRKNIN